MFHRRVATVLPFVFTVSMATREASRRVWTCDSKSEDEGIRARTRGRSQEKTWSGGLTGDLGVGIGELAADDDLIGLRPVEITAGLVALAKEVADEPLGALIQVLEVGGELGIDVSVEKKK